MSDEGLSKTVDAVDRSNDLGRQPLGNEGRKPDDALRKSEQRFRALVTAGLLSVYRMSPDWRLMYELDSEYPAKTSRPIEDWSEKYILEEDRPRVLAAIQEAIDSKSLFELEHRVRLDDESIGWVLSRAVPLLDENGEITEWFGAGSDVTARKQAEIALRQSEAKYRGLFDSIDTGYCIIEVCFDESGTPVDYVFLEVNSAFEGQTGLKAASGKSIRALAPDHEQFWFETYGRIAMGGEPERFEHRADALGRWYSVYAFRIGEPEQHRVAILFEDILDRKRAEEALRSSERHQKTLLAELQHRVRNTLAVVRSIARRTAERSATVQEMFGHLEGRLNAFSRVQSAATRAPGQGIDLKQIVEDELLAVAAREGQHLKVSGPDVKLREKPAGSVSLAIHELATNAVQYGALAARNGRIRVKWARVSDHETEQLHLEWIESGLDEKPEPTCEGFGHEMLLRTLPYDLQAATSIEFTDDGMRFTMTMPLGPEVVADEIE